MSFSYATCITIVIWCILNVIGCHPHNYYIAKLLPLNQGIYASFPNNALMRYEQSFDV